MVQNVYVGPDGGRRQPDRVVWLGSERAWGWGRSAEVLGPRAESSLVLARRLAGTIEKSTPSVSWRFGALRLWLRRRLVILNNGHIVILIDAIQVQLQCF